MAGDGIPVRGLDPLGHDLPPEGIGSFPGCRRQAAGQVTISENHGDGLCKGLRIPRTDQEPVHSGPDHLPIAGDVGSQLAYFADDQK